MSTKYKYPRTLHLPWSQGITNDDRIMTDTSCFSGKNVSVSIKLDGENTSMYKDCIHARSVESKDHISRHWVKTLWSWIRHDIPAGWRICGENLFAKHSIHYTELPSYFAVFSVWDNSNTCLSHIDTERFCSDLRLYYVGDIYNGPWLKNMEIEMTKLFKPISDNNEGYVIRNSSHFKYDDFEDNVGKYVRVNHVTSDKHWMYNKMVNNTVKEKTC